MKAGTLRHRIRLERPLVTPDSYQGVAKDWEAVAEVDAAVDAISGREFLNADRELAGVTWRVTLREVPGVTVEPSWRAIVLDDDAPRTLDIIAVLPSHERAVLTLAASSGTSQT
jgi:head-tail adaptor